MILIVFLLVNVYCIKTRYRDDRKFKPMVTLNHVTVLPTMCDRNNNERTESGTSETAKQASLCLPLTFKKIE